MKVTDAQLQAGGCAACQPADAGVPPVTVSSEDGDAGVRLVDADKPGWIGLELRSSSGLPVAAGYRLASPDGVGSSRVDLQACKLEYSIVSPK